MSIQIVGFVGYGLGALVLASYWARWDRIAACAKSLRKRKRVYGLWVTSAMLTAVCFLLVFGLWIMGPANVTPHPTVFVVGLYTFIAGAILWPWMLVPASATAREYVALAVTAAGSVVMLGAAVPQTMSIPFLSYVAFHHVFIDALWWPLYGR